MLEIEDHIPQENWYVGLLFYEGYWVVKLLRKQQLTFYRPYNFEEEQQVVQKELTASSNTGKVTVGIPAFRYHTMAVLRVEEK